MEKRKAPDILVTVGKHAYGEYDIPRCTINFQPLEKNFKISSREYKDLLLKNDMVKSFRISDEKSFFLSGDLFAINVFEGLLIMVELEDVRKETYYVKILDIFEKIVEKMIEDSDIKKARLFCPLNVSILFKTEKTSLNELVGIQNIKKRFPLFSKSQVDTYEVGFNVRSDKKFYHAEILQFAEKFHINVELFPRFEYIKDKKGIDEFKNLLLKKIEEASSISKKLRKDLGG